MNSAIQTSPEERAYPIRTFQVFGGIQTSLGILSGVLSFAGIVLDGVDINKYCYNYVADSNYYYKRCTTYDDASFMLAVDIPCLVSSGWCILTGILPFCMTQNRRNKWRCLKIIYMLCCILGASLFTPTLLGLAIVAAYQRSMDSGGVAVLPSFVVFLGFVELILVIASSYRCYYSAWETSDHTTVVHVSSNEQGADMNMPTTHIPTSNVQTATHPGASMNMPTARIPMSNVQKAAHAEADMNMPTARIPMSNVQKAAHAGADVNMPTARIPMSNVQKAAHAGADMNMPTARIPMSNVQKAAHAGADMNMPTARIPMSNVQKAAHAGADMNMPTARIPMSNVQKAKHPGADMNMPIARIPMSNVQTATHSGADMNMPPTQIPMSNVQAAAYLPTIMTQQDQVATGLITFD